MQSGVSGVPRRVRGGGALPQQRGAQRVAPAVSLPVVVVGSTRRGGPARSAPCSVVRAQRAYTALRGADECRTASAPALSAAAQALSASFAPARPA